MTTDKAALTVAGLRIGTADRSLVRDVNFTIAPGERVGLVGESGSGKSLTTLAVMGLLPEGLTAHGEVALAGTPGNLLARDDRAMSRLRGQAMGMVFQEPMSALNPVRRVGDQVAEVLRIHRPELGRSGAAARAVELLSAVRLPDPGEAARAYPHQLSGGQRQRVVLAIALANDPAVLLCDEPTSALDVTVQAQVLDLIVAGTKTRGTGLLFVTHDLAVVATVCSRVLVMQDGELVESGPVAEVFGRPRHPYTRALLDAADLTGSAPPPRPESTDRPTDQSTGEPEARPMVSVAGLSRTYRRARTSLRTPPSVPALRDVSFDIAAGQRFGVVGESGSGKSTLVRLLAGLDQPSAGTVRFAGQRVDGVPERRLRFLRENLQLVFQDPTGSLDPRMRVGEIVAEPLVALRGRAWRTHLARVRDLLAAVGLPADAADRYPHQFSGGQRQRISLARALAPAPKVLVADEPVSALDASVRGQVLDLLASLADTFGLTLVFVSHDLSVVRRICDTVAVLHAGELVELGPAEQVLTRPEHPYTQRLLAAVPSMSRALAGATAGELAGERQERAEPPA
ncbi:peptide/nickel transport system ATP-binding protein [Actinopolymorpha cephalotaxi]|uniref:Peptide/nickel transport system ATP-binding protein n=1 Tax=Actinopolymorpha cephalotaxi TaxID=504797 RepID=A0A1I2W6W3_9ACTN|nr:ABC transporter ATP-binding protein [Actinopolymorpha cephalotaxi]NYH82721.1 peptide/nickel transport system ATP-binding protein [Actinopolymorpha cephalotaxi]SFG97093.1 peptide/nickel transport system ATP-binding protein [Actinopolymorpha cephalotaxi]